MFCSPINLSWVCAQINTTANEAHRVLFTWNELSRPLSQVFFSPHLATSWICYSSNPSHPIPRRRGIGNGAEARSVVRERASACPIWSSSQSASIIVPYKSANPWRCYSIVRLYSSGYKPTSAAVRLKEIPDCFCYPLHSKVSLFSPSGYKHKPASVLRNCPPKHAKNPTAENHLLKFVNRM